MTLFQAPFNQAESVRVIPTDTSATTIIPATDYKQAVAKVRIVNETGGAVTADLEVYDGTTAYSLTGVVSIPASASFEIYDEMLAVNEQLRVTAGAGASLVVHAIFSLGAQR